MKKTLIGLAFLALSLARDNDDSLVTITVNDDALSIVRYLVKEML